LKMVFRMVYEPSAGKFESVGRWDKVEDVTNGFRRVVNKAGGDGNQMRGGSKEKGFSSIFD
jgi:hypothetical protein